MTPAYSRVAAVTGANKGIGFAIVRQLALQYPSSRFNNGPLLIYLTARDKARGEGAVQRLLADDQLRAAKVLSTHGGLSDIRFHTLDISDAASIQIFGQFLKKEHPEGIDFVINNAGIAMDGFDNHIVKETLHCNYYGTLSATRELLPLIKPTGRLVNVASSAGSIEKYSQALQDRFRHAKSVDDVTQIMQSFAAAVAQGREQEEGWTSAAYAASKAGVIGMTRMIGAEEKARNGGTEGERLINACCPGLVPTDMTKGRGSRTPDDGAQTPVMLALGDIKGVSGEYWRSQRVRTW
ncbi:carbonyl reductase [Eremomyces bilateralis CBS 781.70]|uniref:Carbonyl reductase n=1 Tax=Eremomyces bilateralis CBS 781.70 TaxID=1392243 RepID=A0A6G1G2L1_9PEZI|nr:carbonyl reductase [Eremomyces bilateralis CBS 781.70]KAF1812283.1 carbonyl reductase [Eremomyces bilateralis CBS 781.70]